VTRQLPEDAEISHLVETFSSLAESVSVFALPRVTDKEWLRLVGAEEFAIYIKTCTTTLNSMTAFVSSLISWRASTLEACLVALCSQWVLLLLQVASAALQLASHPDTPAEMRSFYMVNTAWKEITGLAVSVPPESRQRLSTSFQGPLWTSWQHLMVRLGCVRSRKYTPPYNVHSDLPQEGIAPRPLPCYSWAKGVWLGACEGSDLLCIVSSLCRLIIA
jgi:hypothetical protein